ncbi:MAG TPA: EscS/YscS/HrcS family type III secretion system export apparatus protein [Planctomycetaceae bacterium]|jgi:flagellar biosynthetic protein FliQ|nr:EscS/YscS/HrcS family type III secretion system export apparatus protein [Planctomycetaceae bacterium]MCH2589066.1 flagellar type III secretion system protein FliQ [Planctomycetales bacterium]HAA61718.1 EscS/YscS/HrcS family type III secretion system export apparatus protein [Planctomycetaceae bacterium]HCD02287.1 EscS/YscS/HrcS family type III secretion system export apparatus protein [Planctomycetaceae bacterium]|tara:strand:+ start:1691 stop:1957 length:267 start_codon:yes stop_codon:yes gene_type:complete
MTSDVLTDAARQAVMIGLEIVGPLLLVILGVGLVVGTLQAATQVQDQSVGFVVRLLAVVVSLVVLLPWMLDRLVVYSADLFERIPSMM